MIEMALQVTEEKTEFLVNGAGMIECLWETMKLDHYLTYNFSSRRIKGLTEW